jgi:hypothetical protein
MVAREPRSSLSPSPRTTRSETRARPFGQTKSALEEGECERQQKFNEASELVEASKLFAEADAKRVARWRRG